MTVAGAVGLGAIADQAGSGSEAKDLGEQHSEQNMDPTGATEDTSQISTLTHRCLASYQELAEKIRDTEVEEAIDRGFDRDEKLAASQDSKSRFRAWAVNIAALQKSHLRSSLDFRLKDAAELRQRIVKILEELLKSLENASSIVRGDVENRTWKLGYISDSEDSEDSEGDEGCPQTSELDQKFSAMNATNTNLMKLSMIIRNSPSRDDYLKAASRYNFDSRYDIGHVKEKYGSAKGSKDWLLERFGKGITRRRQFLKYREEHHGKLARDWDAVEEEKAPDCTVALTKATTFVDTSSVVPQPTPRPDSDAGGSFGSQTSYDQTVAGETAVDKLSVPPPPIMAFEGIPFEYGKHFQCRYCFTEQIVKTKAAWKKHVFRDLRPYICTFKECNLRMFRSRNEWFVHELQSHRRHWICVLCAASFSHRTVFSDHLEAKHQVSTSDPQFEALILQSEEAVDKIAAAACPFCDEWEETIMDVKKDARRAFLNDGQDVKPYGTLKQFRRHLGRHMEQLALFALPMAENDDLEDDSASEDKDESLNSASVQLDDVDDNDGETSALRENTADSGPNLAENVFLSAKFQLDPLVNSRMELMRREDFTPTTGGACLLMSIEDQFKKKNCPCLKYAPQQSYPKICTCGHAWPYHEGDRDDWSNSKDFDEQRPLNAESSQPLSSIESEPLPEPSSTTGDKNHRASPQDPIGDLQPEDTFKPENDPILWSRSPEHWIPKDGIIREVITTDITRYLGNDAVVRPGVYEDPQTGVSRDGYIIVAHRNLTSSEIANIKADSARWEQETRKPSPNHGDSSSAQPRTQQASWAAWASGAGLRTQPQGNTSNKLLPDDKKDEIPANKNEEDLEPAPDALFDAYYDLVEEDDELPKQGGRSRTWRAIERSKAQKAEREIAESSKRPRNNDDSDIHVSTQMADSDLDAKMPKERNLKGEGFQDTESQTHDKSRGSEKPFVVGSSSLGSTADVQRIREASAKAGQAQTLVDPKNADPKFEKLASDQGAHIDARKSDEEAQYQQERPQEYLNRLTEDLQKSGMNEEDIELILKKNEQVEDDLDVPTFTRFARRHLSLETLKQYHIDYEFDADPDYLVVKRWVPEYEQDFLWEHTRELRQNRAQNAEAIVPLNSSASSRRSSGDMELLETAEEGEEEEEQHRKEEMGTLYQARMTVRRKNERRRERGKRERRKPWREAGGREDVDALREFIGRATATSAASSSQPAEEPRTDDRSLNAPNEAEDVLLEKDKGERPTRLQLETIRNEIKQEISRREAEYRTIESATVSGSRTADDRGSTLEETEFMKPGPATIPREQEKEEPEAEASPKELRSAVERSQEGQETLRRTVLAGEQNTRALEKAALEAQKSKNEAEAIRKAFDKPPKSPVYGW